MPKEYWFCPHCANPLVTNAEGYRACTKDNFIHWDNPIPVAVALIPVAKRDGGYDLERFSIAPYDRSGIILVKRKLPPFVGEWCLPGGYINKHEIPKAAAAREALEETGLTVMIEQILCNCNPMPGEVNQITLSYLARPVGGVLKAGDDAQDIGVFSPEDMPRICFRSHRMLVGEFYKGTFGSLTGKDLEY